MQFVILKAQKPSGLLSSLGIKTPLSNNNYYQVHTKCKINEIANKLLTGDKIMPEIHLIHLQKTKKEYKNFKKQEIHVYLLERTRESLFSTWHGL